MVALASIIRFTFNCYCWALPVNCNIICFYSREFKEDKSAKEICFPATLTQQEKACIKQTAQEMGLKVEGREVQRMSLALMLFILKHVVITFHPFSRT